MIESMLTAPKPLDQSLEKLGYTSPLKYFTVSIAMARRTEVAARVVVQLWLVGR